jgi:hypothetical protein
MKNSTGIITYLPSNATGRFLIAESMEFDWKIPEREIVVSHLEGERQHGDKGIAFDDKGSLYVNVGARPRFSSHRVLRLYPWFNARCNKSVKRGFEVQFIGQRMSPTGSEVYCVSPSSYAYSFSRPERTVSTTCSHCVRPAWNSKSTSVPWRNSSALTPIESVGAPWEQDEKFPATLENVEEPTHSGRQLKELTRTEAWRAVTLLQSGIGLQTKSSEGAPDFRNNLRKPICKFPVPCLEPFL